MHNNSTNTEIGNRFSFISLFRDQNYRIEIPIIQRDYAQGRASAKNVRDIFLTALYNYLEEGKPNRDLDFVYGSIKMKGDLAYFIPLDGQQRLTTLFLLHWYLALTASEAKFKQFQIDAAIETGERWTSKFSYEVRTSSREFCNALMTHHVDLDNLLNVQKKNQISKTIQNKGWFFSSWDSDPTVKSMLNMLDSIHQLFKGKKDFYDRLVDQENPVITFLFLNLKEFKLTDDLYIKMNARGKPLTIFENFKAKFEQYAQQLPWEENDKRELQFDEIVKRVSPKEYFSFQIDTEWANFFWGYRELKGDSETYDEELMNFIRVIITANYCEESTIDKDPNLEYLLGTQVAQQRKDYSDNLTFQHYLNFDAIGQDSILKLIEAFDVLTNDYQETDEDTTLNFYFNKNTVLTDVFSLTLTQVDRVRFYAYMGFLKLKIENNIGIAEWMRVVYNLTENSIIDSGSDVCKAILSIKKLLPRAASILSFLREEELVIDFFAPRQVHEEKIKSSLLLREEWRNSLLEIEKHNYFKGQVGFLLDFTGIVQYYESHQDCNWSDEKNDHFLTSFKLYMEKASVVFDFVGKEGGSSSLKYAWERAVLCQGDYLIKGTQERKNFLSTRRNMRDYSWKRLLRLPLQNSAIEELVAPKSGSDFVKGVFDHPLFDPNDISLSLERICQNTILNDWRQYFVEEPLLIEYCEQGFIRMKDGLIILYKQSQQNHTQRELRTYNFFLKELQGNSIISPFTKTWYHEVKNGDDEPRAVLAGLKMDEKRFKMHIYFGEFQGGEPKYKVRFIQETEVGSEDSFPTILSSELIKLDFSLEENSNQYRKMVSDDTDLINLIIEMNKKLLEFIDIDVPAE